MVRCGDVMLIGLEDVLLIAALPIKELSKQTFNGFNCSVAIHLGQHGIPLFNFSFKKTSYLFGHNCDCGD